MMQGGTVGVNTVMQGGIGGVTTVMQGGTGTQLIWKTHLSETVNHLIPSAA